MSWEHELARRLKSGGKAAGGASGYLKGQVISPKWDEEAEDWVDGELTISILDGNAMLEEAHLDILASCPRLHDGMTAMLLPGSGAFAGGMKFLVLGVIDDAV